MSESRTFYRNIIAKRKAAESLRHACPSEASYLAGYCLEFLYKFATLAHQGGYKPVHAFTKLSNDLTAIVTQLGLRVQDVIPDMTRTEIYMHWHHTKRYDPDWQFSDMEHIFNTELPEIYRLANKIHLDRLSDIT